MEGRVISVNVGQPRTLNWNEHAVTTSIFKETVPGRLRIFKLGLEGDEQADLTVHGGTEKAVYAYPSEHYEYWRRELHRADLPWGMFGENLTLSGFLEDQVHIGDKLRVGSAALAVTQPRFPCYKLGMKFGTMEMVKRFQASGRSGFYLRVTQEGDVGIGDRVGLDEHMATPTIAQIFMSEADED